MAQILIDTNVLVYACDPADAARQDRALDILKQLDVTRSGRLSVQNLAEFIHVTTHTRCPLFTRGEALLQVEALLRSFLVFDLTPLIVLEAARGARDYSLAYYDAQIWAAARLNQVPVILSEDFTDGQTLEGVRFVNPFGGNFKVEDWV